MLLRSAKKTSSYIKITANSGDKEVGRIFLYIVKNDLHKKPYGLLEDLFVDKEHRKSGVGSSLLKEAFKTAKKEKCYKILATSRIERKYIHTFYKKHGFKKYGFEFRIDL